jgi:ABC-type nitrate/sulfonate/bicarbonate transport system permease component
MTFIAMIGLLGYLLDRGLRAVAQRFTPWAADARLS